MLVNKLKIILAENNLRISKVFNDTRISRSTLTALSENQSKGIQFDTLNTLCNYLKISPGDFFSYTPYDFEMEILNVFVENIDDIYSDPDDEKNIKSIGYCDFNTSLLIGINNTSRTNFNLLLNGKGIVRDDLIHIDFTINDTNTDKSINDFIAIFYDLSRELQVYFLSQISVIYKQHFLKHTYKLSVDSPEKLYIPLFNDIQIELNTTEP